MNAMGFHISSRYLLFAHFGQQGRVVVDDRIGNQPRTNVPYLLLSFRLKLELPAVDEGYGPTELVIGFTPVESFCRPVYKIL